MGSGNRTMQINTRERVVSTDHNRLQAFVGADVASVLAHLLLGLTDADEGGAVEALPTTTGSPLAAAVLGGLRARPVDGTTSMLIEPGAIAMSNPDSVPAPDDVPHKWVVDPGVQTSGQLALTPGGGGTRVDVIECSRSTEVVESDSRDVFNPATGLFTPITVDKVLRGRLQYRIRTGTPGAGYPGHASGWLPLAIASVPSSATTWDAVTLWDVRPLVSERVSPPCRTTRSTPEYVRASAYSDVSVSGQTRVYAHADILFGEYRAGGRLGLQSNADPKVGYVDVRAAAARENGFPGFTASRPWYLYLVFPFGLPRWVRYSDAGAGAPRVPLGTRGIPSLSVTRPLPDGTPSGSGVRTPSATGLADAPTTAAVVMLAGRANASAVPLGVHASGRVMSSVNADSLAFSPSATSGVISATWTLTDGVHYPACARALYLRLFLNVDIPANSRCTLSGLVTVGETGDGSMTHAAQTIDGDRAEIVSQSTPIIWPHEIVVRVPLSFDFTGAWGARGRTFGVRWVYNADPPLFINGIQDQTLEVIGWELGM